MIRYGKMPQMNMASGCEYNYPEFQDYIRKADVVSVQIGSNDALVPCIVGLGEATNWKSEQLAALMVSGALRDFNFQKLGLFLEALNRMTLTFDESRATNRLLFRGMDEICDQAYTNVTASLPQIVASIRALNPDAKIVLLGYTNPVPLLPAWNRYFSKLNRFAKDLAAQEGLIYVDIPRAQTAADGHPTVKGHQYIAQQILNANPVILYDQKQPASAQETGLFLCRTRFQLSRPLSTEKLISTAAMVDLRWETNSTVLSFALCPHSLEDHALIQAVQIGGRLVQQQEGCIMQEARATPMRWRSPPESAPPSSPTGVS